MNQDKAANTQEAIKTPIAAAVEALYPKPNTEQLTRRLLASSREEYGRLSIDFDRIAKRKEDVLQHIAALETVLSQGTAAPG